MAAPAAAAFKAISLTQPWASLVVLGAKIYETRSWGTTYRGLLLVHAAKAMPLDALRLTHEEPFQGALRHGLALPTGAVAPIDLPRGAIIGAVELVDVEHTETIARKLHAAAADPRPTGVPALRAARAGRELAFDDYSLGRRAFELAKPVRFAEPIPCRGMLGIWDVPAILEDRVREQLRRAA